VRESLLDKRAAEVRAMFARIAPRYDLVNRVLSLGQDVRWRREIARRVAAAAPRVVLDVCTGTGDLALGFDGRSGWVAGADFCVPMLAEARRKTSDHARDPAWFAADALQLPLRDASVDVVTVAFGVRNFEDLDRGLAELIRILAPGGRLLVLEFSRPRGPVAPLLSWWMRHVPPRIGGRLSGDREAYTYLPTTVGTFPDTDEMTRRLRGHGLDPVTARPFTGGVATLYDGVTPVSEPPRRPSDDDPIEDLHDDRGTQ
jgi:demethylmenaquinone methyltransferase/2-methoxy-6-polyprenyl-1,4-benzoquinol methylase